MTEQTIIDWSPAENIPKLLFVEELVDNYDGLKILLKGSSSDDKLLEVFFSDKLLYRNTEESYFLRTIDSCGKEIVSPLVVVENSLLIQWLHEESYGIYEDDEIVHYLIFSGNDCIDVLSSTLPNVRWLESAM